MVILYGMETMVYILAELNSGRALDLYVAPDAALDTAAELIRTGAFCYVGLMVLDASDPDARNRFQWTTRPTHDKAPDSGGPVYAADGSRAY